VINKILNDTKRRSRGLSATAELLVVKLVTQRSLKIIGTVILQARRQRGSYQYWGCNPRKKCGKNSGS